MSTTEAPSLSDRGKEYEKKIKEQYENVEDKANKQYSEIENKSNDRLQMEKLLKQARESLEVFMGPDVGAEKQIPITVLEKAKGIVFMTIFKAGLGIGGEMGSGVVIVRASEGGWSPPLAIGAAGVNWGLEVGVSKVDYMMVLFDQESVETFMSRGQLKLGSDVNVSAGPFGRNAHVSVAASTEARVAPIFSYAVAKGAFIGISVKGELLVVREECNDAFYGQKAPAKEILENKVKMPRNEDWSAIKMMLSSYVSGTYDPKQESVTKSEAIGGKKDDEKCSRKEEGKETGPKEEQQQREKICVGIREDETKREKYEGGVSGEHKEKEKEKEKGKEKGNEKEKEKEKEKESKGYEHEKQQPHQLKTEAGSSGLERQEGGKQFGQEKQKLEGEGKGLKEDDREGKRLKEDERGGKGQEHEKQQEKGKSGVGGSVDVSIGVHKEKDKDKNKEKEKDKDKDKNKESKGKSKEHGKQQESQKKSKEEEHRHGINISGGISGSAAKSKEHEKQQQQQQQPPHQEPEKLRGRESHGQGSQRQQKDRETEEQLDPESQQRREREQLGSRVERTGHESHGIPQSQQPHHQQQQQQQQRGDISGQTGTSGPSREQLGSRVEQGGSAYRDVAGAQGQHPHPHPHARAQERPGIGADTERQRGDVERGDISRQAREDIGATGPTGASGLEKGHEQQQRGSEQLGTNIGGGQQREQQQREQQHTTGHEDEQRRQQQQHITSHENEQRRPQAGSHAQEPRGDVGIGSTQQQPHAQQGGQETKGLRTGQQEGGRVGDIQGKASKPDEQSTVTKDINEAIKTSEHQEHRSRDDERQTTTRTQAKGV